MKIIEILTRYPSCIGAQATLVQAARQMKILDVGMLPVCDKDLRVIGAVTDRDIVTRGVAQEMESKTAVVQDIMTADVISCCEDQDVAEAARLMEAWQIRRLPVVNREKRLVGMVSLSDLAVRTKGDLLTSGVLEHVSTPPALCEPEQMVA